MSSPSHSHGLHPYEDGVSYSDKQAIVSQSPLMLKQELYPTATVTAHSPTGGVPTMPPGVSPEDARSWNGSPASVAPYPHAPYLKPAYPVQPGVGGVGGGAPLQAAYGQPPQRLYGGPDDRDNGRTIFGVRPATFFLSLALVLVIIVAAVGGGVGGSMAVDNARRNALAEAQSSASNPATVTATVTVRASGLATTISNGAATTVTTGSAAASTTASSSSRVKVATSGQLDFSCASATQSTQTIKLGDNQWSFAGSCGTDFNGDSVDIAAVISYTFSHCLQACASYNRNLRRNACVAVAFHASLDGIVTDHYGNCFLKNSTGSINKSSNTEMVGFQLQT